MNRFVFGGILLIFFVAAIGLFKWNANGAQSQQNIRAGIIRSNNNNNNNNNAKTNENDEDTKRAIPVSPPAPRDEQTIAPVAVASAVDPSSPAPPVSQQSQQQSDQKRVPFVSNTFVERYFQNDPVAQSFSSRAWEYKLVNDKNKAASEKYEQEQLQSKNNNIFATSVHSSHKPKSADVVSTPGHTGSRVPEAFGEFLQGYEKINELADEFFGAQKAVDAAEESCGWDKEAAKFSKNEKCIDDKVGFNAKTQGSKASTVSLADFRESLLKGVDIDDDNQLIKVAPQLMDIVVPSIRDLDFLENWRDVIEGYHLIFVQDGDPKKVLKIPAWVDYELYNRNDIEVTLKSNSWIISQKDASIRNFGFLVSRKPFIYTLDDDCFPVTAHETNTFDDAVPELQGGCSTKNPRDLLRGTNPILGHLKNLLRPSTPYFFNTLYDGYKKGTDFVRGFPYSMRDGVPTAISHGLWLNVPDYDAPTQLLKPKEKNTNHVDTAVTIPAGVLYPMCSMNVAFDRKRIGPAFMQGLMGVGMPWARYDDMFAGWASKVVADHLAVGVKSGAPYIFHKKASNPFTNLKKEYKGLWWQEVVIAFCNRVQLPTNATTPESAYRALAFAIRQELLPLHPYFDRLATAMLAWVDAWEQADAGTLTFAPSRKSDPEEVKKQESIDKRLRGTTRNESKCMSYEERYAECRHIRKQPVGMMREYFRRIAGTGRTSSTKTIKEVVAIFVQDNGQETTAEQSLKNTSSDAWLHVCSLVVEASASTSASPRDVVLIVASQEQLNKLIPSEFVPLVKISSIPSLAKYNKKIQSLVVSTPQNGLNFALEAHFLFQQQAQIYEFVWILNSQRIRYAGDSWGTLLSKISTATRKQQNQTEGDDQKQNPDLITFSSSTSTSAFGAGIGISRKLAQSVESEIFTFAVSPEETTSSPSALTLSSVVAKTKAVALQMFAKDNNTQSAMNFQVMESCDKNSFYKVWKTNGASKFQSEELSKTEGVVMTSFKNADNNFDGKDCLSDFVSIC